MALANVAVLLARWGYKTLMIDWDLEAPGLEYYFKEYMDVTAAAQQKGVIELLQDRRTSWKKCIMTIEGIPEAKEPLYFLTAGQRDDTYFDRLRDLDVSKFYKKDGGRYIEKLRQEWIDEYDFVLVDSRTGITDIGGICTIQMPDIMVALFTANDQSLNGAIDVAQKTKVARQKLPFDRFSLRVVPIPSRFDSGEEFKTSREWLERFSHDLADIYSNWLPQSVNRRDFLEITKIPYISYFSFGEKLPVIEQGTLDPTGLGYYYENLAAIISTNLETAEKIVSNRNELVRYDVLKEKSLE